MQQQYQIRKGLYEIFMDRLREAQALSKKEIVPFPVVFEKLCRNFSLTKPQCWQILFILRDFGFIEVVCGHGVRINSTNH